MSALNLIFIGPPGAGKGTQAEALVNEFDLAYLATGDMMRAKRKEDSELGRRIAKIIAEGGLVDDEIVCTVVIERIDSEGADGFLLDGFPRTTGQADKLDEALESRSRSLTAVLLIEAPDEVIVGRLAGRRVCEDGHVYHVDNNPPRVPGICDADGSELYQRDDDRPDVVRARYQKQWVDAAGPVRDYYADRGLIVHIDAAAPQEQVAEEIDDVLDRADGEAA